MKQPVHELDPEKPKRSRKPVRKLDQPKLMLADVAAVAKEFGLTSADLGSDGTRPGVWGLDAHRLVTFIEDSHRRKT